LLIWVNWWRGHWESGRLWVGKAKRSLSEKETILENTCKYVCTNLQNIKIVKKVSL